MYSGEIPVPGEPLSIGRFHVQVPNLIFSLGSLRVLLVYMSYVCVCTYVHALRQ